MKISMRLKQIIGNLVGWSTIVVGFVAASYIHENAAEWELVGVLAPLPVVGALGLTCWRLRRIPQAVEWPIGVCLALSLEFSLFYMIGHPHDWITNLLAVTWGILVIGGVLGSVVLIVIVSIVDAIRIERRFEEAYATPNREPPSATPNPREMKLLLDERDTLSTYPDKAKLVRWGLVQGGVLTGLVALAVVLWLNFGWWMMVFGWMLALLGVAFGFWLALNLIRIVLRRPALVLTRLGILDNASFLVSGVGFIPWRALAGTHFDLSGPRFGMPACHCLVVESNDPLNLRKRLSRGNQILLWLTYPVPTPIRVPEILLPIPIEVLAMQIEKYVLTHVPPAERGPYFVAEDEQASAETDGGDDATDRAP